MSIVRKIGGMISSMRQRSKDRTEFFDRVVEAAQDGKLDEDELHFLTARYRELGLTERDIKAIRVRAYEIALHSAKSDGRISDDEQTELDKLQQFFRIPDSAIHRSKQELLRLRILAEIQDGNLPSVSVPNLVLQKNERAYWSEPASILEERVVRRRYEGGSSGISIKVAKGVSFRVGAHRGELISDRAILPVSDGDFVITSRRLIFRGDRKSFNFRLDEILDVNMYSDGVRVTCDKGTPRTLKFAESENAEVVGAVVSYAINRFEG